MQNLPADAIIPRDKAINLVTPAAYATDAVHETHRWLRANNPLGICAVDGFDPFWVVTKHEDLQTVSRNNALFLNGARSTMLASSAEIERAYKINGVPHVVRTLVQMDGTEHRKYRGLTQTWFLPGNVRKREGYIQALAKETVDKMAALGGRCDFAKDVAVAYPLQVIMNILGVPPEDYPLMLRLTQEIFGAKDPEQQRSFAGTSPEEMSAVNDVSMMDMAKYFAQINADRRANPRDDLASVIANATIDGEPIGPAQATGYYVIVATAGHDTTSSSVAGAMWALATVPGLLERLKANTGLIPQFVDEALRWSTPVKTFMRSASEDTELRGRKIAKDDWLMLCFASANRDEEVFPDPFSFNIDRNPNAQLAFGTGAHGCLGQHLARAELRALFEEMVPRLKSVNLTGDPRLIASYFVSGIKSLPLEFEMS